MKLKGQVAIVTGSSKGIGRAIAIAFARQGADVVVTYAHEGKPADQVVRQIRMEGSQAVAVKADVSRSVDVKKLVALTMKKFGRVDILVNNATYSSKTAYNADLADITEREWDQTMAVDVKGTFLCSRAVWPAMKKQQHGVIINISSSSALQGDETLLLYGAAKSAIAGFTKSLAKALGPYVRVCAIAPGSVKTGWIKDWKVPAKDIVYMESIPALKRLGEPEDIASVAVFLASDDSRYITGQTLVVDGGIYFQ